MSQDQFGPIGKLLFHSLAAQVGATWSHAFLSNLAAFHTIFLLLLLQAIPPQLEISCEA
jgi:hypothetical protein